MTEGTAFTRELPHPFNTPPTVTAEGFKEATVVTVEGGTLRLDLGEGRLREATLAVAGYSPAPGDQVLTASGGGRCWLIGVLEGRGAREVRARSGHHLRVVDGDRGEQLELRDAESNLLLRFDPESGNALLAAPGGDLTLAAPTGNVNLVGGRSVRCLGKEGVELRAGSDGPEASLQLEGGQARLAGEALSLQGRRGELRFEETTILSERLDATVERARWAAERVESTVGHLLEQVKTAQRTVEGLQRLTVGRLRTLVTGAYQLKAGHAAITTTDELKLDGKRIYLG